MLTTAALVHDEKWICIQREPIIPEIVYVASKHVPPGIADQFEHGRRRCAVARSAPPVSLLECVCVCVYRYTW